MLRRLRRCSLLVIGASKAAAASTNIKDEVDLFAKTGRNMVIVDVEGASATAVWSEAGFGLPKHVEDRAKFAAGLPPPSIVRLIVSSMEFVRRTVQLRRGVFAASALGILGGLFLIGSLVVSARTAEEASVIAYRSSVGAQLEQDSEEPMLW